MIVENTSSKGYSDKIVRASLEGVETISLDEVNISDIMVRKARTFTCCWDLAHLLHEVPDCACGVRKRGWFLSLSICEPSIPVWSGKSHMELLVAP